MIHSSFLHLPPFHYLTNFSHISYLNSGILELDDILENWSGKGFLPCNVLYAPVVPGESNPRPSGGMQPRWLWMRPNTTLQTYLKHDEILLWLRVTMYLTCGPRQLFFFHCGPEMPKARTPLLVVPQSSWYSQQPCNLNVRKTKEKKTKSKIYLNTLNVSFDKERKDPTLDIQNN